MFKETAEALNDSIDAITKDWVDDLRRSKRTEVHKTMLTAEIVDGMKAILQNLAQAVEAHQAPDNETAPLSIITGPLNVPKSRVKSIGTRPLSGPLELAQRLAADHGRLRHTQRFELHEVVIEYIKLRQHLWNSLELASKERKLKVTVEMTQYLDRLLDELMLSSTESYHDAAVRDLEKRAIHDPLTQLYNKEYFRKRLHEELRRAIRHQESLTVAMLDMDMLKPINDTYGHQAGDAAIIAVASAIRETCRQADVPCRYGGDEFAVILPETVKLQSRIYAERVMAALHNLTVMVSDLAASSPEAEPGTSAGRTAEDAKALTITTDSLGSGALPLMVPVPSISVGLASFPEDGRNPEMLIARADAALYRAKRAGRNKISF
ncbi:MAG: GGDEF domain-containing protein [Chloroflexota bacterium]|nr:GGDEF domain-containing protein [Chloroflexota bacterium]